MEKEVIDYDFKSQLLEDRKERIEKGGLIMEVFDETTFLKNKPVWLKELFGKVNSFCLDEVKRGVVVTHLETYCRYTYRSKMFCKMKCKMECLKVYLKLRYPELESPPKWVRDYAQISHQTWVEAVIREEELLGNEPIFFDMLFDLIRKSFNRVIKHPKISEVLIEKPVKTLPGFVTPTKMKFDIEIGTDGFCCLKVNIHKSQLSKTIEKLL